jgi:hypothetical protein
MEGADLRAVVLHGIDRSSIGQWQLFLHFPATF